MRAVLVAAALLPVAHQPVVAETSPQVQVSVPPRGWDPLTATPDELNAYNIPPRPTDPDGLISWTELVTQSRWERPKFQPGRASASPNATPTGDATGPSALATLNWGGIVSRGTYTNVSGRWRQPYAYAPQTNRPALATQWVGLGGFAAGIPLIQMGTEARVYPDGSGSYDAWYEIVGTSADTGGARTLRFTHRQGDEIEAQVWWTEANGVGTAHFYIADRTLKTATSFSVPKITGYAGVTTSAEWINELPTLKHGSAYLTLPYYSSADAAFVSFTESQAGQGGQMTYVDPNAPSTIYVRTHRGPTLLQGITPLGAKGDFQTIWIGY